jgi:hypothetical protein
MVIEIHSSRNENSQIVILMTFPLLSFPSSITISLPRRLVFDIATIRVPECPFTQKNHLPVPL